MVSMEQAKNTVREFLVTIGRDAGFDAQRIAQLLGSGNPDESPNVGAIWIFKSTFGTFWVSQRTGEVVFYATSDADTSHARRIEGEAADAAAQQFIRVVYQGFDQRNFKLVNRRADDESFTYDFEEAPKPPEISIFPNFITVSVDANRGRVTRYSSSNLPFKRTTLPRITEPEARRIIQGLIAPHGEIEKLWLHEEAIDGASRSITLWSAAVVFRVGGEESADRIAINADTGERFDLH